MNDDDLTELILRASAYLDGELDAEEQALAEADPAVMAEVEVLRSLQAELRDVASPAAGARESAIAAALAQFDAAQFDAAQSTTTAAAPEHTDRVVPFRPRPAYSRWLTAAAAVVAIGLVGVVIAQSTRGGDDEQSAIEPSAAEASTAEQVEIAAADAELRSSVTDALPPAAAEAGEMASAEADDDTSMAAGTESADQPAEDSGAPPSSELTLLSTVAPSEVPQTTAPRTLDEPVTEDTLFAVGRDLLAQSEAGTLGITPETACEFGSYVILARVGFVVGDDVREAIIAADPDFPEVGAFDASSCLELSIVTGE